MFTCGCKEFLVKFFLALNGNSPPRLCASSQRCWWGGCSDSRPSASEWPSYTPQNCPAERERDRQLISDSRTPRAPVNQTLTGAKTCCWRAINPSKWTTHTCYSHSMRNFTERQNKMKTCSNSKKYYSLTALLTESNVESTECLTSIFLQSDYSSQRHTKGI